MHQQEHIASLLSIQTAEVQTVSDGQKTWTTGFYKMPVDGPIQVGKMGLAGDEQADTKHHGGTDKAILGYSADHRDYWKAELQVALPAGGFGENLTIAGIDETSVCIGDRWLIGDIELEVSQPRQPCWKLGHRWNRKELPKLVIQNGRSGWYFRVLQGGTVCAGMPIALLERRHPDWTVDRASRTYYGSDAGQKLSLAQIPQLSTAWKLDLTP